jgi:hypothetical protein
MCTIKCRVFQAIIFLVIQDLSVNGFRGVASVSMVATDFNPLKMKLKRHVGLAHL